MPSLGQNSNRHWLWIISVISLIIGIGTGILIGYFGIPPRKTVSQSLQHKCGTGIDPMSNPVIKSHVEQSETSACEAVTCDLQYPASYVAFHLGGDTISVDGKLDDAAWQKTPKIDKFKNILGPSFPEPWYDTYAMIRWNDEFLYIGAYLQEKTLWAAKTQHDTRVWLDNCFEVFVDTDFSTHMYKEWQINVINTTWDLLLTKPYVNEGMNVSAWELEGGSWAAYAEGSINDPTSEDTFWSMEVAMPFTSLIENNTYRKIPPSDGDQWRINLSRVEYELEVDQGKYRKKPGKSGHFWVWQPQYANQLHLPERWGFVQFSTKPPGDASYKKWSDWNVYSSLIATYNEVKTADGLNDALPETLDQLTLPPHVMSGTCSRPPTYNVTKEGWEVKVQPLSTGRTARITDDRLITFL